MEVDTGTDIKTENFYSRAKEYWEKVPPTVDGMLGGFSEISRIDAEESIKFLRLLLKQNNITYTNSRVLDCGAGIGRVTKFTLSKYFETIDMVEQCQTFLDNCREYLGQEVSDKVQHLFCSGLQDFSPETEYYDVIWNQWVLGHLKDAALVDYFKRCKTGIKKNGFIVVKENIASTQIVDMDDEDSSITRPRSLLISLIEQSGLTIVKEKVQTRFPAGLYEVRMFALK